MRRERGRRGARRRLGTPIAQYAASHVYDRLFEMHGWAKQQQRIRQAARERDEEAMVAAVPEAAINAVGVACRPDHLAERAGGIARDYDQLTLVVPPWGLKPDQAEAATLTILAAMR